ncbi:hypothetical protein [Polynucleobacter necessarius]|uniref:hypothetical protein n=1 Tax=Polynucleobacter necessarius TaxID=576610 RepID=UPI0018D539C6|nr:hypothetical protein [Polynucleobacter necessarius]
MSKNKDTQRIPILVDEGFIKLHPGVVALADENSGGNHPFSESIQKELENGLIEQNPLIIGYPATNPESAEDWSYGSRHELLEPLFVEALARKCA